MKHIQTFKDFVNENVNESQTELLLEKNHIGETWVACKDSVGDFTKKQGNFRLPDALKDAIKEDPKWKNIKITSHEYWRALGNFIDVNPYFDCFTFKNTEKEVRELMDDLNLEIFRIMPGLPFDVSDVPFYIPNFINNPETEKIDDSELLSKYGLRCYRYENRPNQIATLFGGRNKLREFCDKYSKESRSLIYELWKSRQDMYVGDQEYLRLQLYWSSGSPKPLKRDDFNGVFKWAKNQK